MKIVDLSHPIEEGIPTYNGGSAPIFEWNATFETRDRTSSRIKMSTHTGTHVDAPLHFIRGGASIDEISLDSLVGPASLINVSALPTDGRYLEFGAFKIAAQNLIPGDIAVIYSGMGSFFGQPKFSAEFPALTAKSVDWLLEHQIRAYATDAVSVDPMDSLEQLNHKKLLGAGIPIIECLNNLSQLKNSRFFLVALPLKLNKREAAPCRALAIDLRLEDIIFG